MVVPFTTLEPIVYYPLFLVFTEKSRDLRSLCFQHCFRFGICILCVSREAAVNIAFAVLFIGIA